MSRVSTTLRRRASLALLPLSIVPFVAVAPVIADSHREFDRAHNSGPLTPVRAGTEEANAPSCHRRGDAELVVSRYSVARS